MIHSLRARLAASHILPVLVLVPLLGLLLLYSAEQLLSHNLLRQLAFQARILRHELEQTPGVLDSPLAAERFLAGVADLTEARVVVISQSGEILASSRPGDASLVGTVFSDPAVAQALQGIEQEGVGQGFTAEVAYVALPLHEGESRRGVLRLSIETDRWRQQSDHLRWIILGSVGLTAVIGLGLGLGLATTITRPLRLLNQSTQAIAGGNFEMRVPVRSSDEISRLASSFNQMAARLEEAEHSRGRQLAAISHELTRPLAGMRAAVETLQDGACTDPETSQALLEGIEEELARLQRLVATLQQVHRRALRPLQLQCARVALERIIRASVASFEPLAGQNCITLSADLQAGLPEIWADEDRLIQVVTNLLDNAFKFTPGGGHILVRAGLSQDRQTVWISVADSGVGITPDELPHLFEEFYTGRASRPPEKRGMGLGLAICREIVSAHGGHIEVDSQPGQGACFRFELPVDAAQTKR